MPYEVKLITKEELIKYQSNLGESQVKEKSLFTELMYWLKTSEMKLRWSFNDDDNSFLAHVPSIVYDGKVETDYLFYFRGKFYNIVLENQFKFQLYIEALKDSEDHEIEEVKSKIAMSFTALEENDDPLFQSDPIFTLRHV